MSLLPIDMVMAFAICGAGSVIGAAMMPLVGAADEATRIGKHLFAAALLAVGVGMSPLLFLSLTPPPWAVFVAALGGTAGTVFVAWGFRAFDHRPVRPAWLAASVAVMLATLTAAWFSGPRPYALAIAFLTGLAGIAMLVDSWNLLRRPRDRAEAAMGVCIALFGSMTTLRMICTVLYEGPHRVHEVYVPEAVLPVFGAYFATLPVVIALLVVNLVNSRLQARLLERASIDDLTGALSRRAFTEAAPRVLERAARDGRPVALLMVDIDHFKSVNDRFGHAAGDEVLARVAHTLGRQLRPDALLARWGGEEFALLLLVEDERNTRIVAERLRREVEMEHGLPGGPVTVSIGVARLSRSDTLTDALERADMALYRAKRGGRNRVEFAMAPVSGNGAASQESGQRDGT